MTSVNAGIQTTGSLYSIISYPRYSINYVYTVGGVEYTGAGVSKQSISEGTVVDIMYDTENPGVSIY